MRKLWLAVVACFISTVGLAQVPVPYRFTPGTPASATQVNANFDALVIGALNVSGGTVTGNMLVNPGITIDGVDIGKILGGEGSGCTDCLVIGTAKFVSTVQPQLTVGYDQAHLVTISVDLNGNALFDTLAAGSGFAFNDPAVFGVLTSTTITTVNFSCAGCIGATQIADGSLGSAEIADGSLIGDDLGNGTIGAAQLNDILGAKAGVYGDAVTVSRINVDADGRIIDAVNTPIAFPAPPVVPPSYALGANQIPETAIIDGTLLARVASPENINGNWSFSGITVHSVNGFSVPAGALDSGLKFTGTTLSIVAVAPGIYLRGGPSSTIAYFAPGSWLPGLDDVTTIGDQNTRIKNINLILPNNTTPAYVVVNKGGGGGDSASALGYVVGYSPNGEQIKQMGACTVAIRGGIIVNVTGC